MAHDPRYVDWKAKWHRDIDTLDNMVKGLKERVQAAEAALENARRDWTTALDECELEKLRAEAAEAQVERVQALVVEWRVKGWADERTRELEAALDLQEVTHENPDADGGGTGPVRTGEGEAK